MELASKGELFEYVMLNSNIMTQQQVSFYFKQIINGLEFIHRNNITHRDLKPQNILIDENNIIKIGDFGLSNVMKDGKLLKTFCGSYLYAAPEIIDQKKYEGTSIDIWSCGVILYFLLVKKYPFQDDSPARLFKKMQHQSYTIPTTVSNAARNLIGRMLQFDPRRRISLQQIKCHPWFLSEIPIYMNPNLGLPLLIQNTNSCVYGEKKKMVLDQEIMDRIKELKVNLKGYTQQKKDNQSFVIAYQLLKSEKDKKQYEKKTKKFEQSSHTIFSKIPNTIPQKSTQLLSPRNPFTQSQPFMPMPNSPNRLSSYTPTNPMPHHLITDKTIYGRLFNKSPKYLAEKIMQILRNNDIQYEIKSQEYCIKCCLNRTAPRVDSTNSVKEENSMMTDQTQQQEKQRQKQRQRQKQAQLQLQHATNPQPKPQKFSQNQLKFTIQIYEVNRKNQAHIVDITLSQGNPYVFFPIARKIYGQLAEGNAGGSGTKFGP